MRIRDTRQILLGLLGDKGNLTALNFECFLLNRVTLICILC